jgi:hypothetical protein
MKKIVVKSHFGRPVISTTGYDGDGCLQATAGIERALAGGDGGVEVREFNPGVGVQEEQQTETN